MTSNSTSNALWPEKVTAQPVVEKTVIHNEVGFTFKETVTSKDPVTEAAFCDWLCLKSYNMGAQGEPF